MKLKMRHKFFFWLIRLICGKEIVLIVNATIKPRQGGIILDPNRLSMVYNLVFDDSGDESKSTAFTLKPYGGETEML